ncbi:enoyl-CoA hydratase [Chitinivorax tropicus]|uniref:Enoyl-CoA hydratase n=1 Tax=Chitinivorax tropicus TaxID=714531 RepID=A0A840MMU6_9PROT|nr:crotonase/enoyl-CoA hydratase family protein [Chitinivorax tropicus]MBB5018277.1 enoyl-CoA hydratase [Chitinivorax tropicus]
MQLDTIKITLENHIALVELNRPDKANAMDERMWADIRQAFDWIDDEPAARVAVLAGNGKHFCSGIDLMMMMGLKARIEDPCEARSREKLRRIIVDLQDCLTALERCRKPVLAAIHGACVGGGVDLICAADMRYTTDDAYFCVKEADMGLVADVGTLQRLPRLIGEGQARELAYTCRRVSGTEAVQLGLANRSFADRDTLLQSVMSIAADIARKSPLVMRGTKQVLNYSRDHSVADGLDFVAGWNAAMLMSADIQEAIMASMQKRDGQFRD